MQGRLDRQVVAIRYAKKCAGKRAAEQGGHRDTTACDVMYGKYELP
jgi:hypothetical protein